MTDEYEGGPHDDAAERYVLAAAIHSAGRTVATGSLRPDDFHDPRHGSLFTELERRVAAGDPIEPSSMLPIVLGIRGLSSAWLVKLLALAGLESSVEYYAGIVRDRSVARAIIAAGRRAVQIGEEAGDAADILEEANAACDTITRAAQRGQAGIGNLQDELEEFMSSMDKPDEFTPTPWPDLDRFIGGWAPGGLYILGARPGHGKSLIGVCAALHAAARGHRTFFASVEMGKRELYRRMIANVGKIDHDRLVRKALDDDDWANAVKAQSVIGEMLLHVSDDLTRPSQIIGRAQEIIRQHGPLGLVVVDYVQLMTAAGAKTNRQEVVAEFSRSLKLAAKSLDVPVLALAQLNRNVEGRNEVPRPSDLRESGALEQDADVVLLLHHDQDGAPDVLEVSVAKNRHGVRGAFDLSFQGRYQRLMSIDHHHLKAVQ